MAKRSRNLFRREALAQIAAKARLAMFAQAIVAVEVVDHVAVDAALDAALGPGLQHGAPVRIVQAGREFPHAADAVVASTPSACRRRSSPAASSGSATGLGPSSFSSHRSL